jgi:hypothetical protein
MTYTFRTPYEQYRNRDGESIEIVRKIETPDEEHDEEVLPMYVVRFEDGTEIEAWPEELWYEAETDERDA